MSFDVKGLKYKLDYLATKCKQYFFVSSSVAYSFEDEVITENTKLGMNIGTMEAIKLNVNSSCGITTKNMELYLLL